MPGHPLAARTDREALRPSEGQAMEPNTKGIVLKVTVERDEEDGGFVASVSNLRGVYGQGETPREAQANLKDALNLTIRDMIANGEPLPESDEPARHPPRAGWRRPPPPRRRQRRRQRATISTGLRPRGAAWRSSSRRPRGALPRRGRLSTRPQSWTRSCGAGWGLRGVLAGRGRPCSAGGGPGSPGPGPAVAATSKAAGGFSGFSRSSRNAPR